MCRPGTRRTDGTRRYVVCSLPVCTLHGPLPRRPLTFSSGHYYACVMRDGRWYKLDDHVVTPTSPRAQVTILGPVSPYLYLFSPCRGRKQKLTYSPYLGLSGFVGRQWFFASKRAGSRERRTRRRAFPSSLGRGCRPRIPTAEEARLQAPRQASV